MPKGVYDSIMDEKRRRHSLVDDGLKSYPLSFIEYLFTFLTRQAAHKRILRLKKEFPILVDFEFGQHDLRRLKIREIVRGGGIEEAQKEMKHGNQRTTMMYLDQNHISLNFLGFSGQAQVDSQESPAGKVDIEGTDSDSEEQESESDSSSDEEEASESPLGKRLTRSAARLHEKMESGKRGGPTKAKRGK